MDEISTIKDLKNLPFHTMLRDTEGTVVVLVKGKFEGHPIDVVGVDSGSRTPADYLSRFLPMTVLYRPDEEN